MFAPGPDDEMPFYLGKGAVDRTSGYISYSCILTGMTWLDLVMILKSWY